MPATPLPGEGLELPLSEYNRLRAFQGGGWFWDHENQQVIREVLGDFLPRVEERPKGSRGGAVAFFQHFSAGTEVAGKSVAVGAQMNRVPRAEYDRLQAALETFKRKAENPHTDPNARRIIEKFCLPDPAQNPELYRLHGSAWNRRLLVLWGCEKEQGTSLAPTAALQRLSVEPASTTFFRRLPVLLGWLLLLLLLAALIYYFWPQRQAPSYSHDPAPMAIQDPNVPQPNAPDTVSEPLPGSSNAGASPQPAVSGEPTVNPPPVGGNTPGTTRSANGLAANSPGLDNPPAGSDPVARPEDVPLGQATSPGNAPGRAASGAASPRSEATNTNREARASDPARPGKSAASPTPGTPGTPEEPTGVDNRPDVAASPAKQPSPVPANAANGDPSKSRDASAALSPTATPPVADPGERASATPAANTTPPAASVPGPSGLAPKLEILSAASAAPHDGKLDFVLMAAAHHPDGSLATVEIKEWSVDGIRQQDRTGQNVTTGQLALTLPTGKHRVNLLATSLGQAVECEAEVNVQIKSQGDVTVTSGVKK